jgi:hypothetical protein
MPVIYPHEKPLILVIHRPVDGPVETLEPLQFHPVQVMDGNAAHFRPRSILECIIVKELASEEETSR